jgi:hypothetical protein
MASGYLCLWCGENPPGDDWQRHVDLCHRYEERDRQRCRTMGYLLVDVGVLLLIGSVGRHAQWPQSMLDAVTILGHLTSGLQWPQSMLDAQPATLLRLLGLACLADAGCLWLSCWGLARSQAWQRARARWTAALQRY